MDEGQSVLVRRLVGAAVLLMLAFGLSLILPDPSKPPGADEGMERVELRIADGGRIQAPAEPLPQDPDPSDRATEASPSLDMAASPEVDAPTPADDEPAGELADAETKPEPRQAVAPVAPPPAKPQPPKPVVPAAKPTPPASPAVVAEKKPVEPPQKPPAKAEIKPAPVAAAPVPTVPPAPTPKPEAAVASPPPQLQKPPVPPAGPTPPVVAVPSPPPATKPAAPEPAKSWLIQAGVYADIANARQVETQLKSLGYGVTLSIIEAGGSARYRVRCGPFATRELADAARARLTQNHIPASLVPQGG